MSSDSIVARLQTSVCAVRGEPRLGAGCRRCPVRMSAFGKRQKGSGHEGQTPRASAKTRIWLQGLEERFGSDLPL